MHNGIIASFSQWCHFVASAPNCGVGVESLGVFFSPHLFIFFYAHQLLFFQLYLPQPAVVSQDQTRWSARAARVKPEPHPHRRLPQTREPESRRRPLRPVPKQNPQKRKGRSEKEMKRRKRRSLRTASWRTAVTGKGRRPGEWRATWVLSATHKTSKRNRRTVVVEAGNNKRGRAPRSVWLRGIKAEEPRAAPVHTHHCHDEKQCANVTDSWPALALMGSVTLSGSRIATGSQSARDFQLFLRIKEFW